jgi:predicted transcriptional regulator
MAMDTLNAETGHTPHPEAEETEAERQARIAWEAEGIAKADADIAAGRLVDAAAVRAWVESIGTDHELPVPYSGR